MHRSLVALTALLALLGTACAGGDDGSAAPDPTGTEVRPFREIQDGEVTFEADPLDPSAGIFRVDTTEPAICAIVWGETEDFGRFNNSLAMNGTGIVEHDVALPDLEPGREYVYVLQGTTADGTLYRSEVDSFTIPVTEGDGGAASPAPDLGPNLALEATIAEVSSEFDDGFAAANAIDGDLATEWSSRDDGDDASITLDLGASTDVTGVAFLTRSMADGTAITETFTVTVDGETLGPFPAGSPAAPRVAEVAASGQRLTFEVASSTGGNVGAVEIQVFGD